MTKNSITFAVKENTKRRNRVTTVHIVLMTHTHTHRQTYNIHIYIYIYIERERERERESSHNELTKNLGDHRPSKFLVSSRTLLRSYNKLKEHMALV
jgi:hypothetical protein